MKHLAAIVLGFLILLASLGLLVMNAKAVPLSVLVASGVGVCLACALIVPAQFKEAVVIIVPLLPDFMVGGRRKAGRRKTDSAIPDPPLHSDGAP